MKNNKKADPKAGPKRKKHAKNSSCAAADSPALEVHLGTPNPECACCRQPFDETRRRAGSVRIAPQLPGLPLGAFQFQYDICGDCKTAAAVDQDSHDATLRKVVSYHMGDEAAHE